MHLKLKISCSTFFLGKAGNQSKVVRYERNAKKDMSQKIGNSPYLSFRHDLGIVFARGYDNIKIVYILNFSQFMSQGIIKDLVSPKLNLVHIIIGGRGKKHRIFQLFMTFFNLNVPLS